MVWVYGAGDGEMLRADGEAFVKKPNPVYMVQSPDPFIVHTDSGVMEGRAGDWIVHDPISGHVWPITDDYKQAHYEVAG